jgi:HK97 family phage major capsid protein
MTSAELRQKATELREKIAKLVAKTETENRELNAEEEAVIADFRTQEGSLKRRAAVAETLESDAAESRQSAGRIGSSIDIGDSDVRGGEAEQDRRTSFSDWLVHVDRCGSGKTPRPYTEVEQSRQILDNCYKSQYRDWTNDKRAKETRNLAMSSGTTGGFLMPVGFYNKLLQVAAPQSIVRPLATVIPQEAETVKYPSLDQTTAQSAGTPPYFGGVSLTWTGESATIGATEPGFRQTEITLNELTGYLPVGRTLLNKSPISLEPLVYSLFGGAVAYAEDYAFLRGNGSGKPMGLLNPATTARIKTGTARGSATAISMANAIDVWTKVIGESQNMGVWVVSKFAEAAVLKMTTTANSVFIQSGIYVTDNSGGEVNAGPGGVRLMNRPVYISAKLPAPNIDGDFNFFDFSKFLIGDGGPPEVAASDDYLFRTNERAFRVIHRVGGAAWMNNPITLEDGSTTNSPFVSLTVQ